jgi:hypothetical protein
MWFCQSRWLGGEVTAALAGVQTADAVTMVASATALSAAYVLLRVRPKDLIAVSPHEQPGNAGVAG